MPSKVSRSINLIETGWQATPTGARKTRRTLEPVVDFLCNAMGVCAATSLWSLGIWVRGRVFFCKRLFPRCVCCIGASYRHSNQCNTRSGVLAQ